MKKKLFLSWYCAECKKSGIAEVELPMNAKDIETAVSRQHDETCDIWNCPEIRDVDVAVK